MIYSAHDAGSPCLRRLAMLAVACLMLGCQASTTEEPLAEAGEPHMSAGSAIEAGRYLVVVAGCNDCHTDGYLASEGDVPEEEWLKGSPIGWRGPWGTTYAKNLRLTVEGMTEDQWVEVLRSRSALPPMPWMNLNQMAEQDARAVYQYIRSLGGGGESMPLPVPPDQEPETAFISLMPVEPSGE